LYARAGDWDPATAELTNLTDLDQWAVNQATRLARDVDQALEQFDTQRAGKFIAEYVDDLSNWYVRRSRRRFWDADPAALSTLHHCLKVVTQVMAPFTPFITERVWQDLFAGNDAQSVHLTQWPAWTDRDINDELRDQVELTRRIVELGRAARANSGVKTRQPLQRALVAAAGWADLPESLQAQIREEVNVLELDSLAATQELVDVTIKANFKTLGARFGKQTPDVANAIAQSDARDIVNQLKTGSAKVKVGKKTESITSQDVIITEVPRAGWTVASESGESLALDLALSPELVAQGIARDITRLIQDGRKSSGFEISDRIAVTWSATNPETQSALEIHGQAIATEVLATSWVSGLVHVETVSDQELGFSCNLTKAN
jgi:isoleucyl-tRNA synthetase